MIWLSLQLLLIVAFGLNRVLGFRLDPTSRLKLARQAIIAAVVLPAALFAVPSRHLPRLPINPGRLVPEMDFPAGKSHRTKAAPRPRTEASTTVAASIADPLFSVEQLQTALVLLILGGVLVRAGGFLANARRLRVLVSESFPLRQLGRVKVIAHPETRVPFSFRGARAAWVVIPEGMLLNPRDLRIALRHELQHHRSGDTIWVYALEILTALSWVNPFAFLWKREFDELHELSCDATLLGQSRVGAREYADCLVRVAQSALESRTVFAGTASMAAGSLNRTRFQSFLGRRIEMLVAKKRSRATKTLALVAGTALSLALLTVAYGSQEWMRGSDMLPNPGTAVMDPAVQAIAESSLQAALAKHKAKGGFVIVADPNTGRVLAVANVNPDPKFHPTSEHWAVGQRFEPASIAKGVIAAEALNLGLTRPDETINCEKGQYLYHGKPYRDWNSKEGGFDKLTMTQAIAQSSNICGIKLGEKLGVDGIDQALKKFGFGPGGVTQSFPEARAGELPKPDTSESSQYVPVISTGYSFYPTPLEIVSAYSVIANGGHLMRPVPSNEQGGIELRRVMSESSASQMREVLRSVVTSGTGHPNAASTLYTTAGKTSSSSGQSYLKGEEQGTMGDLNAAGFVGFAPVSKPRIAVYALIIDPTDSDGGAHGAKHAAPLFKEVIERVLQSWKVPPDQKS